MSTILLLNLSFLIQQSCKKQKSPRKQSFLYSICYSQDSDEDSGSDVPIIAPKTTKKQQVENKKVAKIAPKKDSDEEEDTPIAQKQPQKQLKTETGPAKKAVPQPKKPAKKESSE
jgi:hypothetical protein